MVEEKSICCPLHAEFFLVFPFDPEDGGGMFFNRCLSTDYTALYPRRLELFITTAVRTSGKSYCSSVHNISAFCA
jgi:hypothetical protein